MHFTGRFAENRLAPAVGNYLNHSEGYFVVPLVDQNCGSVHTELSVNQLARNGTIAPHVHSYEEGFYILSGSAIVSIDDNAHLLGAGDYGAIKVGSPHAWRNAGSELVRWLQMAAPQPKTSGDVKDTFFLKDSRIPIEDKSPDLNNPKGSMLGHFDISQIPPMAERQDVMKGLEGVFLNWLIDSKFGTSHHRMAFIEYQPGAGDRTSRP